MLGGWQMAGDQVTRIGSRAPDAHLHLSSKWCKRSVREAETNSKDYSLNLKDYFLIGKRGKGHG